MRSWIYLKDSKHIKSSYILQYRKVCPCIHCHSKWYFHTDADDKIQPFVKVKEQEVRAPYILIT
jgi:hypothetical protein